MKVTETDLNLVVKLLNERLGIDGCSKDGFIIDKQKNDKCAYRLEQVNGQAYGIRTTRENLYWHISAMIDGIMILKHLENEGKGEG